MIKSTGKNLNGDKVTITTENACYIWDSIDHYWIAERHTHTINRNDIKTVYFM